MILKQLSRFKVEDSGMVRVVTRTSGGMATTSEGWLSDRARDRHSRLPTGVLRFLTAGTTRMCGGR